MSLCLCVHMWVCVSGCLRQEERKRETEQEKRRKIDAKIS